MYESGYVREMRSAIASGDAVAVESTSRNIGEHMATNKSHTNSSLKKLFCEIVPNGRSVLESSGSIIEAAGPVNTQLFNTLTSQLLFSAVLESWSSPEFLWRSLVKIIPTNFANGEKLPGVASIGDSALTVAEGDVYPRSTMTENVVDIPKVVKKGHIVDLTREVLQADQTGLIISQAGKIAETMAINLEKRILDVVTGVSNTYKFNGTAYNTYLTSGAYVNTATSTALTDWTSIEAALLLFDGMTDPVTGEPIMVGGKTLLVPSALKMTAARLTAATMVAGGSGAAFAADPTDNVQTWTHSANPLGAGFQVLSNAYVKARTSSASTWFIGDFQKAFALVEANPITVTQQGASSEKEFERDIVASFKVNHRGTPAVIEPRYVVKCTA